MPIALSGILGAMSVIAVNSWMNQPGGFTEQGDRITSVNVWQVYFNHAALYEMPHMILAAYMVTGFTVAGVYAAGILRGRRDRYHHTGFALGFVPAAVLTPFQIFVGDTAGRRCRCLTARDCASPTPAHYDAGQRPAVRACAAGLALLTVRAAEGAAKVNRCRETAR